MKKILFITVLIVLSLFSVRSKASEFTLRMFDNTTFDVVFDSESFNDIIGSLSLQNVSPGRHYIKVLKYRLSPGGNIIGMPKLAFEGMIKIRSGVEVYAMIDRYGRYIVEEEYALNSYYPSVPPPVYVPPYMSDVDFAGLKATIDRLSFDSSKLTLAEQAASSNVLTSRQVFEIMELFTFESSKLSFAKYAYHFVYDPNTYFLVNNAFTFSSSIASLNSYIVHPD